MLDLIEYLGKRVGFDKKRGISGSWRGCVGLGQKAWVSRQMRGTW